MSRPDLVSMLLDVSIDPCDGSVHPSLQYVLIRGFSAMGWEQPKAASEDMAMEILKMIRPSSSNLASGGKVASREYPALGDRVATLLEDARCPKVTPAMEEAGRECARSNDPSTFADIFEAMWKARPTARPDSAESRLREALVAAKCTSRDGTVVHASMDAVIAALDALVPADGVREDSDLSYISQLIAENNELQSQLDAALAQTEGGKSLTSSDGSGSNAARTCDVPAASPSGDVTQAGHSPLIASDQERNRVRKDAGVAPGPSDPSSTHSEETVGDFAGWCESNGYFASVSFIRALLDQFEIRRK